MMTLFAGIGFVATLIAAFVAAYFGVCFLMYKAGLSK